MGAMMLPLFVIGTATQAVGTLMAAGEKKAAAEFEAKQYRIQEQQYRTAAARDEANRRADLNSQIGTIMAIRAGRGVGQGSPTGVAILEDLTQRSEGDIGTQKASLLSKADQARMAGDFSDRKARMAMVSGGISALGQLANAGFTGYQYNQRGYFG